MGFCEGLRVRLAASVLVAVVAGSPLIRGQGPVEALGESWRWRVFDRREGLTSSNVSALYQDRHEFIYAATERGLSRYDLWEWTTLQTEKPFDDGPVKRFVESPSALFAVTANVVWRVQGGASLAPFYRGGDLFAADNDLGEVYVIDALRERHLQVRGETAEPIDEVRLPAGKMLAYEIDAARNHWLATSDGLFRRDLGRRSWQEVDERSLDASLLGKRCVRFFRVGPAQAHDPEVEDMTGARPPGILWALFVAASASASGSDAPAQTLARLESGVWLTVGSLEGPLVEQICADLDAAFLATAEDGRLLASADGKEWRAVQALGIGKTALHGGLLDTSGILWFQNGAGGVVAFDSRSRSWEALSTGEGTTFPDVLTIAETEEGEIWLGMTRGVTRLRHGRKPETWERVLDTSLEKITGIGEDGLQRLWISSAESFNGAFYFVVDENHWVKEEKEGLRDQPVRRIVADSVGELWFLSGVKRRQGGYVVYRSALSTSFEPEPVLLPQGPANDLARTREDILWVATDEGLLRGGMQGDNFLLDKLYTDKDGLLSIQVWAVKEGPDGSIWVCYPSSGGGVTRIQGPDVRSYQESDGLTSPDVWSIAVAGQSLWFGTGRGLSRFDGECWYGYPVASLEFRSIRVWPIVPSRREPDCLLVGTFGQGAFKARLDDRRRPRFVHSSLPDRFASGSAVKFQWDARDYRNETPHDSLLYRSRVDRGAWSMFSPSRTLELQGLADGDHSLEVEVRDLAGNRNREEFVHRFAVGHGGWGDPLASGWAPIAAGLAGVAAAAATAFVLSRVRRLRRGSRHARTFRDFAGTVLILDAAGKVSEWSGATAAAAGVDGASSEDLTGGPAQLLPVFQGAEASAALRGLLQGHPFTLRATLAGRDGAPGLVVEARGFPLRRPRGKLEGAVVLLEDRTDEVVATQLGERTRRLDSLRRLAGRMVRDLSDAEGATQPLDDAGAVDPARAERLRRVRETIRKLGLFADARDRGSPSRSAEVGTLVERLIGEQLERLAEEFHALESIKIDYRGHPGLWKAAVEEPLLADALREVLRNALDALPSSGVVTVRLQNVRLEDDPAGLPAGAYVEISVRDTGVGMDAAQLATLFEPFLSTKPRDTALGVGLAIAYGVVRSRGGDIRVESRPSEGTYVRILVPAARGA